MKLKSPRAVAGLGLALLLALIGGATAAGGGSGDTDDGHAEAGRVIAASVSESTTPVLADLADPDAFVFDAETTTSTTTATSTTTSTTAPPEPEPAPAPETAPAPAPEPAPVAEPAPTYAPGSIEGIIESYFGPDTPKALSVARCESGLNPSAMSPGGGNHGLFQINNVHSGNFQSVTGVAWSGRYDPHANTAFAKWLFDQSGWGPWACA